MDFVAIIPARFASTRLPGKPLLEIAGKPMVIHVAERAAASGASEVCIATDHEKIADAAKRYGFQACLTDNKHASGTERIAEVARLKNYSDIRVVVNVQGDEPLIEPALIREVAEHLEQHPKASMSTACHPIEDARAMFNPNVVKVVLDHDGYALYFSRAPIPYARDAFAQSQASLPSGILAYRHIGIYAYRAGFLRTYAALKPSLIEQYEALEQLRVLANGYRISVSVTRTTPAPGVDTQEDLENLRSLLDRTQKRE